MCQNERHADPNLSGVWVSEMVDTDVMVEAVKVEVEVEVDVEVDKGLRRRHDEGSGD